MLISLEWLRDFVDVPTDLDPRRLAERFTTTVAEVEGVERVGDDWIIEIDNKSITHRPDLWGHYGIAREMAAMLGLPLRPLGLVDEGELTDRSLPEIPITLDEPARSPRYSGLRMQALGAATSPLQMQSRLARVGMRPISFLVDLTNYIMAEIGQPMHAFDAARVDRIEVGLAAPGETFRTLDHVDRTMPAGTLMIKCGGRSVAIAGIMGGAETEVTPGTREILLESANFNAAVVRRASAAMGLRTEASARFEKSLDPRLTVTAIRRFVYLARRQIPDLRLSSRLSDAYPSPQKPPTIRVDPARLSRVVGQPVSAERIRSILTPLEFDVRDDGAHLAVTPPTFRATKDISIEADIVEEVARYIGYGNIEEALPSVMARPHDVAADRVVERRTIETLCQGGSFIEIHGYIWYDDDWLTKLDHEPGACVRLKNPVAASMTRLRRSLAPGLLAACERNRWRFDAFDLLEIGSTFAPAEAGGSEQRRLGLAVVRSGKSGEQEAWNQLKIALETWGAQVAQQPLTFGEATRQAPWEDARRCCDVRLDGRPIGRASLVPLDCRVRIDERMRTLAIALAEVDLTGLDPDAQPARKLASPPAFPEVELDFSFLCDMQRRYAGLVEQLGGFRHGLLRRLHLRDAFEGGAVPEGRRSFTVRAVLGAADRTLNDDDLTEFRRTFSTFLVQAGLELRG